MKIIFKLALIGTMAFTGLNLTALPTLSQEEVKYWVTTERLNRRTCPSQSCGIVGKFFFRDGVSIYEQKNGWGRMSRYYNVACEGGKNVYVDSGNSKCDSSNGVIDGQHAEWVAMQYLSKTRPADPAEGATGFEKLIADSDDFARYRTEFAKAAKDLIARGKCTKKDFLEYGGWLKSTQQASKPVYFIHCGGFTNRHKIYLNAKTGEFF